jgi:very-short-patch-repair endonuclease
VTRQLPDDFRELLTLQCGVFARWQANAMAVDRGLISARLSRGRWRRRYHGVYAAFTGRLCREAELWAAVLRAGPEAVLSHQTAAEVDRFAVGPSRLIHVTVPLAQHMVRVPGIVIHRSGRLELARHPSRTPPRTRVEETALDLAHAAVTLDDAFGWISRPCSRRLTMPPLLLEAMRSRNRMRWRAELTLALADVADGVLSPLEHRYVRDVERAHGLPAAKRQVLIERGGRSQYLDNLYEQFGLGVELDGQAYHPAEDRWKDIGRDNALAADGILILRYGWPEVSDRACTVAIQVGDTAATRGWSGTLRPCGPTCSVPRP